MIKNLYISNYTLNRRHNAIFYHQVMEAQAVEISWVVWIEGIRNLAGVSTKTKTYIPTRQGIMSNISNNSAAVVISDGG